MPDETTGHRAWGEGGTVVGRLARLAGKIFVAGLVVGGVTAALGIGAIAVSELLSRRSAGDEDQFDDEPFASSAPLAPQELDDDSLALLACPVCKTSVPREGDRLICSTCGRRYPI